MDNNNENQIKTNILNEELKQQYETWKGFIKEMTEKIKSQDIELSSKKQELENERTARLNQMEELQQLRDRYQQDTKKISGMLEEIKGKREAEIKETGESCTKKIQEMKIQFEKENSEMLEKLKNRDEAIIKLQKDFEKKNSSYKQTTEQEIQDLKSEITKLQEDKATLEQSVRNNEEEFFEQETLLRQEINDLKNKLYKTT
ncbi:MAG: hypothetical protein HY919_03445 [Elusimicrobia bacterium]|nr:hypothetical protein [Elusimicrobiota bacterium]